MRKQGKRLSAAAKLAGCVVALAVPAAVVGASGAGAQDEQPVLRGAFQSEPVTPAKLNIDLSTLPRIAPGPFVPAEMSPDDQGEEEGPPIGGPEGGPKNLELAPKVTAAGPETFTSPNPNFDGIGYTALVPPDTNGDVGPSNYIQMVNSRFEIFNKQGVSLAGPSNISTLWSAAGFPGPCATRNDGDPVVVYDNLADRWVMTEFANPTGFSTPPTHECVAVSQTGNPVTGGWFLYDFTFSFAHDYPKIGVWPDGYYMTSQRGFPGGSLNAVVFDRVQMIAGNPATFQSFNPAGPALILLPSDLDGKAPPAGTPNFFARAVDGGLWGGNDRIDLFAFHVDWANAANSTFTTLPALNTAANDQNLCGGTNLFDNCVPQPGTGTQIETLPHWSQGHLQYRNFGTRETLVFDHTVDADNTDHAGVQWFQMNRPPSGAWSIFQQAVYAPDAAHRWMGSLAMDKLGDLALGYSISDGTSIFPGVRYTGRQPSDPLGQMPQPETTLVNGGSAQTFNGSRWGDYASLTVDPADDCTYWFTTEYVGTGGFWSTRIGAFKFTGCAPISATGTPVNAVEGAPFSGTVATVTDPDTTASPGDYTASIDWGDATAPSAGVLSGPTGGPYLVTGSHTYEEEGSFPLKVTVTDKDTPLNTSTATTTATVADAPLSAACANAPVSTTSFSGSTATFTDADPHGIVTDYTASIDWGDGSAPSAGTIAGGPGHGPYTVTGTHTYGSSGVFTIKTTATDHPASATATCQVVVFAFAPGGGAFVVGDLGSTIGSPVTFWGAQWSSLNALTGGAAPSAFKGFARNPATPACGTPWSTDPGNSSNPPSPPLPSLMGVIAAGTVTKSGSQISGDTPHIVVVQTNAGYDANPGHAGTGKVVAVFC